MSLRVIFLGTAGSVPTPKRSLPAIVIQRKGELLIFDCGEGIQRQMIQARVGFHRKTRVFITHMHADHFALVTKLVTDTSTIYFNQPDAEILKAPGGWKTVLSYAGINGFPEDVLRDAVTGHPGFKFGLEWIPELSFLKDGDTLEFADYLFRCVETPGHTKGHICLYEPTKKILVSGDHILNDITPNIQCWRNEDNPLKNYLASLDKVYDLQADLVLPGHRRLFRNLKERIDQLKGHHHDRLDEVLLILGKGSKNAFQVASEMTWDIDAESWDLFPAPQKWFATGEAISHLRYLEEKGAISRDAEAKTITYALNHK